MTLFSPDDLNQVFPEATQDALADPNLEIYSGYAEAYVEAQDSAGRIALTGGSKDAIGEIIDSDNLEINNDSESPFKLLIAESIDSTISILEQTIGVSREEIDQLYDLYEKIDIEKLEEAYNYFEDKGLEPKIVFTPEGRLIEDWQDLYNHIYHEKRSIKHSSTLPLCENALEINDVVKNKWPGFSSYPFKEWSISIVSCSNKKFVDHTYFGDSKDQKKNIKVVLNEYFKDGKIHHPTISSYLMLQAILFSQGKPLLDNFSQIWMKDSFADSKDNKFYRFAAITSYNSVSRNLSISSQIVLNKEGPNSRIRPAYFAEYKEDN